jgi:O-antigen/teichoic acid export membrane protein
MLKKLLSDSMVYGLSGIMAKFVGFLLLPLYSKILSPADYGVLGLYNSSFFLLFVFLVFGMDSATFRFYYDNDEVEHQMATTATWVWFQLGLSLLFLVAVFFLRKPIGQMVFGIPEGGQIAFYMACSLTLYALPNIQEVWFRIKRKPWGAFSFSIFVTLINIGLTYYFIVYERIGFWAFIKAQVISYGIGSVISLYLLRHQILPRHFRLKLLQQMLKYAFPLVPAMAFHIGIGWVCNYILSQQHNYTETGLYNMGNTFALVLNLVTTSFAQAYLPFAYSIMKRDDARQIYSRVFIFYISGMGLLAFGYGLFSLDVLKLVTRPEYYGSWLVMIILAYHYFLLSTAMFGNIGAGIQKNSKPYSMAVAIGAISSIVLFLVLIPVLGKEGAALGLLLGQLCVPVITFYTSQRMYPIPYNFRMAAGIVLSSVVCSVAATWFPHPESLFLSICFKGSLFILYGVLLLLLLKRNSLIILSADNKWFSKKVPS